MAIDILTLLVSELVLVVQDNGKAFATYIADLFSRCKVQKVILHSLLAGINDMRDNPKKPEEEELLKFTEEILIFNEIGKEAQSEGKISNYSEAFQVQVLRLLLSLVMLEQAIGQLRGPENIKINTSSTNSDSGRNTPSSSNVILRYHNDHVIPDQPMFLAAIVSALRQEKMRHLHSHWTSLVTSCLPFLGKSLSQSVLEITAQISRNLEHLAPFYGQNDRNGGSVKLLGQIPADYVVSQLEALTMIYHYCLLDPNSAAQIGISNQKTANNNSNFVSATANTNNTEIFSNLLHAFLSNTDTKSLAAKSMSSVSVDTMAIAKKILLSTLPRLIHTTAVLWQALNNGNNNTNVDRYLIFGNTYQGVLC